MGVNTAIFFSLSKASIRGHSTDINNQVNGLSAGRIEKSALRYFYLLLIDRLINQVVDWLSFTVYLYVFHPYLLH